MKLLFYYIFSVRTNKAVAPVQATLYGDEKPLVRELNIEIMSDPSFKKQIRPMVSFRHQLSWLLQLKVYLDFSMLRINFIVCCNEQWMYNSYCRPIHTIIILHAIWVICWRYHRYDRDAYARYSLFIGGLGRARKEGYAQLTGWQCTTRRGQLTICNHHDQWGISTNNLPSRQLQCETRITSLPYRGKSKRKNSIWRTL